ncbi:MAG TPA: DUF402 domain-containing protein [Nitrospirota bacterium]|nr:DUF402 domain-containing protein [Nitrospirota bacterium]
MAIREPFLPGRLRFHLTGKRVNSFDSQRCIETKTLLSGAVQQYHCKLLHLETAFGILRYVIDKEYCIAGIRLMAGGITTALYWIDRPYTLYIWQLNDSMDAVYYFNIADSISLLPDEFRWRDLTVDILVDAAGAVHVLDEDELPADLPVGLQGYILAAKSHVLSCYRDIIREVNFLVKKHVVDATNEL